jgi:hypothetical protein
MKFACASRLGVVRWRRPGFCQTGRLGGRLWLRPWAKIENCFQCPCVRFCRIQTWNAAETYAGLRRCRHIMSLPTNQISGVVRYRRRSRRACRAAVWDRE